MKKIYIIIVLLILIFLLSIILILSSDMIASWSGWNAISALSTAITSIGIIFAIYQLNLQKRSYNIEELNYVMNLTDKFIDARHKYWGAWAVLRDYNKIPSEMYFEEYSKVTEALQKCYESAYINFQIAQLVENGIIDLKTLYVLHFNFLSEQPDTKLSFLHQWIETGLDLASNYDRKELLTIVKSAETFYDKLYRLSSRHGIDGYKYQVDGLAHIKEDLMNNSKFFDISDENYGKRFVEIIDDDKTI